MTIMEQLTRIFHLVFDDEEITLARETTADHIDGWDSLSHMTLIVAIEKTFGIRFTPKELLTFRNVGDLLDSIAIKVAKGAQGTATP